MSYYDWANEDNFKLKDSESLQDHRKRKQALMFEYEKDVRAKGTPILHEGDLIWEREISEQRLQRMSGPNNTCALCGNKDAGRTYEKTGRRVWHTNRMMRILSPKYGAFTDSGYCYTKCVCRKYDKREEGETKKARRPFS